MEATTTELPDRLAPVPPAARAETPVADGRGDRGPVGLRVLCHLAAEVPLVLLGALVLGRGWRPVSDNAGLALRSWQVLSARSPLIGHQMALSAGSHTAFGPGPLQSWILALPVRIDPAQGALWGAVLAAVVAVALAIEASWAVDGWRGAAVTAGVVLVVGIVRTEVVLDVVWNVWFALVFLLTTFATGRAVAAGRVGWWPVTVLSASVVVQCQAAFAPPAVALCLLSPVLGLLVGRRLHIHRAWLLVGCVTGVAVWAAPLVQEVTGRPGNLTVLLRASGTGPDLGPAAGLRALGGATRWDPTWVHQLPGGGAGERFYGIAALVDGPEWWGIAVLVLVAVVGATAWHRRREGLAVMAWLTLALAGGTVLTLASVPVSQFVVVGYLGVLLAPVGMAMAVTALWAVGAIVTSFPGQRAPSGTVDPGDPPTGAKSSGGWLRWAAAMVVVGLAAWLVIAALARIGGTEPTLVGWPTVRATEAVSAAAARVAPSGPFGLSVTGPSGDAQFAIGTGADYLLVARGLDPRLEEPVGYPTFGRPPLHGPTVSVHVAPGGRVTARLVSGPG